MEETNKPPEETAAKPDASTIPNNKWPWICTGLCVMLLTLWNKIGDKDIEIKRLNDKAAQESAENRKMDFERARSWEQLYHETNKVIHYSDTTSSRSGDFDSPARFEQSGKPR